MLQSFQYKLINRYIACRSNLKKWNKAPTDECVVCKQVDTIEHFIYDCRDVQHFWNTLFDWLENLYNVRMILSILDIIFGIANVNDDIIFDVYNFCILFAKFYIYECKIKSRVCIFEQFLRILKIRVDIEKCIAIKDDNLKNFLNMWEVIYTKLNV